MSGSPRARVVLGVGGGIAAYKACELLRRLTESGHDVTVVPTASALQFVGRATWEALSGKPVTHEVFDGRPRGPARDGSGRAPTSSSSHPRRPTCWPRRHTAWPTTC